MSKHVACVVALAAVGVVTTAPSAIASYNNWGVISVHEGKNLVAQGKGSIGVDFNLDVIGGHVAALDPRPKGSPAYSEIDWNYVQPTYDGVHKLRGADNYSNKWVDRFKVGNLNPQFTQAEMWAKSCQNDKLGPDACRSSRDFNQKW